MLIRVSPDQSHGFRDLVLLESNRILIARNEVGEGDQFAKKEAYEDWSKRMNDQATMLIALNEAAFVIANHFEPGTPRDPVETIKRLIDVLDSQELAAAISGSERGRGLRVVN